MILVFRELSLSFFADGSRKIFADATVLCVCVCVAWKSASNARTSSDHHLICSYWETGRGNLPIFLIQHHFLCLFDIEKINTNH